MPKGSETTVSIEDILELAIQFKASDIHLKVDLPPMIRVDGNIRALPDFPILDSEIIQSMIIGFLTPQQQQSFEQTCELDCALVFGSHARVRVNVYRDIDSIGASLRIIPLEIPTLDELHLSPIVKKLTKERQGFIIVTGVTGAGKSTTLAAMINEINARDPVHIYTLEDPIEFVHHPKRSIITQRELGLGIKSFATALKSAMRADPNVILIGEMRDPETIQLALRAAETGHLVLSTLHTASASKTLQRILGALDPGLQETVKSQLATSLKGVIAQQLVPMIGGGRICVQEIMVCTNSVQDAIMKGHIAAIDDFIKRGSFDGMQTMDAALYNTYREGLIDAETARQYAMHADDMERALGGATI